MSVFLCASMINVTYTHRDPGPVEDCGNIAQTNWDPQNILFFKEKLLPWAIRYICFEQENKRLLDKPSYLFLVQLGFLLDTVVLCSDCEFLDWHSSLVLRPSHCPLYDHPLDQSDIIELCSSFLTYISSTGSLETSFSWFAHEWKDNSVAAIRWHFVNSHVLA